MKVLFDNCTSPVLASTLHGFIQHQGHAAIHIKDAPCGRHAPDLEWIAMLRADPGVWVVVTGDDRIHRNKPERAAFRGAGLTGFVLHPSYQKTPQHQCASFLLWRWPEIASLIALVGGPALFDLPMNRHAKLRQLPL